MEWTKIFGAMLEQMRYESAIKEYNEKSLVYRLFHKAPKNPNNSTIDSLCKDYVDAYNDEHQLYIENDGNFSTFYMCWNAETHLPILVLKTYGMNCFGMERKAFSSDGSFEDWGCPYPYSECGISQRMELKYVPYGSAELYAKYDSQVREISTIVRLKSK